MVHGGRQGKNMKGEVAIFSKELKGQMFGNPTNKKRTQLLKWELKKNHRKQFTVDSNLHESQKKSGR